MMERDDLKKDFEKANDKMTGYQEEIEQLKRELESRARYETVGRNVQFALVGEHTQHTHTRTQGMHTHKPCLHTRYTCTHMPAHMAAHKLVSYYFREVDSLRDVMQNGSGTVPAPPTLQISLKCTPKTHSTPKG